jgi:hypothetical protein
MLADGIQPNVDTYNTLIYKSPAYNRAVVWLDQMREMDIQPVISTYNGLIYKAPDWESRTVWLDRMREKNIRPNIATYNCLILTSPDYETALSCLDKMRMEDIRPNIATYYTLIHKTPDYVTAERCLDMMQKEGLRPNLGIYDLLINKAPDHKAETWLDAAFQNVRSINKALRLALEHVDLQASKKFIQEHLEEAVSYFKTISIHDPVYPNVAYALGVTLKNIGEKSRKLPEGDY